FIIIEAIFKVLSVEQSSTKITSKSDLFIVWFKRLFSVFPIKFSLLYVLINTLTLIEVLFFFSLSIFIIFSFFFLFIFKFFFFLFNFFLFFFFFYLLNY